MWKEEMIKGRERNIMQGYFKVWEEQKTEILMKEA